MAGSCWPRRERRLAGRRRARRADVDARRIVEEASGFEGARAASSGSTSRPPTAAWPTSTRWSTGGWRASRCSTCSARGAFRTLDLHGRPPGAHPATGDRGGGRPRARRARPRSRCRSAGEPRPTAARWSPTSAPARVRIGAVARRRAAAASRCGPPTLSPDALDVCRANLAGLGPCGGRGARWSRARGSTRCPPSCGARLDLVVSQPALRRGRRPAARRGRGLGARGRARARARPGSRTLAPARRRGARLAARPGARSWSRSARPRAQPSRPSPGAAGFAEVEIRPDHNERDRALVARL